MKDMKDMKRLSPIESLIDSVIADARAETLEALKAPKLPHEPDEALVVDACTIMANLAVAIDRNLPYETVAQLTQQALDAGLALAAAGWCSPEVHGEQACKPTSATTTTATQSSNT